MKKYLLLALSIVSLSSFSEIANARVNINFYVAEPMPVQEYVVERYEVVRPYRLHRHRHRTHSRHHQPRQHYYTETYYYPSGYYYEAPRYVRYWQEDYGYWGW